MDMIQADEAIDFKPKPAHFPGEIEKLLVILQRRGEAGTSMLRYNST